MKRPTISTVEGANPYLKVLLHGPSGAGKTRLAASFDNPLFLDIEGGTSSASDLLKGDNIIPSQTIALNDVPEYLDWAGTKDADKYNTIVLDSLTHLQSKFLTERLGTKPDPRMVYGDFQQYLRQIMDKLHRLKKHTVIIARSKAGEDIEGAEKLLPELAPSAFSVVPALVDYALVVTQKSAGIGKGMTTRLYSAHPKYWTKTRSLLPADMDPNFTALQNAIKASNGKV